MGFGAIVARQAGAAHACSGVQRSGLPVPVLGASTARCPALPSCAPSAASPRALPLRSRPGSSMYTASAPSCAAAQRANGAQSRRPGPGTGRAPHSEAPLKQSIRSRVSYNFNHIQDTVIHCAVCRTAASRVVDYRRSTHGSLSGLARLLDSIQSCRKLRVCGQALAGYEAHGLRPSRDDSGDCIRHVAAWQAGPGA